MINNLPEGFFLVDKPVDWTSFDAVNFLKKKFPRGTKIGHAGTLDPFATGLLIVAVGRAATKRIDEFKKLPKIYETTVHFGATSNTDDPTGIITPINFTSPPPTLETVKKTLNKFLGKQSQIPPMFSAKKINGQKLYHLARQGKEVERQPTEIEIYSIDLLNYSWPDLNIRVTCSTGTYIRTLARDIGTVLGCGAYCLTLRRQAIGNYLVDQALSPEKTAESIALTK